MTKVTTIPISAFDPINLVRSSQLTPERYLTIAVFVIPNLNISMKAYEAINKTHLPNSSIGKLRASRANPVKPNNAIVKLPVNERKLSSEANFLNKFFKEN